MQFHFFYLILLVALVIVIWIIIRGFLVVPGSCLPVLMYHKVSDNGYSDYLTIPAPELEAQFQYLQQEGYTSILLSDVVKHVRHGKPLPPKPVLITFDDGYRDNYTIMYPRLKKYGMKAVIFLVPSFLQTEFRKQNQQQEGNEYLRLIDMLAMDRELVEYGLHSYDHESYKTLTPRELSLDILMCRALLIVLDIPFQPCLAFPYGAYPKRRPVKLRQFFNTLKADKIELAFRIGNRLNPLPLRNPLLIQRLDIRGDEPFQKFVQLIKKGKSRFL